MRKFGVEEELLLIDGTTGVLAPVAEDLLRLWEGAGPLEGKLTREVKKEQLELVSAPYQELSDLAAAIGRGRAQADRLAMAAGARAVALGTYPMRAASHLVQLPRYAAMDQRFGMTLKEQLTCGFHIHVSVDSDVEAVAVLDRIRVWLPLLLALSSNSPFWQGTDTGYSSYRYQVWKRWPTAGPTDIFGSAEAYRELIDMLLQCDVLLDSGMVYFDARLSADHPTIEVRIADVCLHAGDATALAALVRALVENAAREWQAGNAPPACPTEMLRLASWRASNSSLHGALMHPLENRLCPAETALDALLDHVSPVLGEYGDLPFVLEALQRIRLTGTGADRQRESLRRTGNARDILFDALGRTHAYAQETCN